MNTITLSTCLGISFLLSASAEAASVYINSSLVTAGGAGTNAAQVKIRAGRNAGWDSALGNKVNFSTANSLQQNLTSNFSAGQTYTFTLENRPGQGLIYTITPSGGATSTTAWGKFSSPVSGTVLTSLNGRTPPAAFNTITLENRATLAGSSAKVTDLVFSGPGIADGGWANSTMTPGAAGNAGTGINRQTLYSDGNLAQSAWTMSGNVTLTRPNSTGSAEAVRTLVQLRQTPLSIAALPVPEPGTTLSGVLAAGSLLLRRRRRA